MRAKANKKKNTVTYTAEMPVKTPALLCGWWPYLWLGFISFIVYAQTLPYPFMPLDDPYLIQRRLPFLSQWSNIFKVFTEPVFFGQNSSFYRPLLTLSFMWDTIIGKGQPWVYHLSNILLHLLAVLLLFLVLRRGLRVSPVKAFLLSAFLAVHPALVPAIAFLPGRNDTLLAVFVLSSFLCFLESRKTGKLYHAFLHLLFFLGSLLAKESAVVLAPLLILWMAIDKSIVKRQIIWLAAGWASVFGAYFWLHRLGQTRMEPISIDLKVIGDFCSAMLIFLGKTIMPIKQSILPTVEDGPLLLSAFSVLAMIMAVMYFKVMDRSLFFFGLVWYFAFLTIPTIASSSSIMTNIHHEHRLYVPAIGWMILLAQLDFGAFNKRLPKLVPVIIVIVLVFMAGFTITRNRAYSTPLEFGTHAVIESPGLYAGYVLRGEVFLDDKEYTRALADFKSALALKPNFPKTLFDIGKAYYEMHMPEKAGDIYVRALKAYSEGIKRDSTDIEQRNYRGFVYMMMDSLDKSISDYSYVLKLDKNNTFALNNRGKALLFLKQYEQAIGDLSRAIIFDPKDGEAYHNRAVAFFFLKEYPRAWQDINAAQNRGIPVVPDFITALRQASGQGPGDTGE